MYIIALGICKHISYIDTSQDIYFLFWPVTKPCPWFSYLENSIFLDVETDTMHNNYYSNINITEFLKRHMQRQHVYDTAFCQYVNHEVDALPTTYNTSQLWNKYLSSLLTARHFLVRVLYFEQFDAQTCNRGLNLFSTIFTYTLFSENNFFKR